LQWNFSPGQGCGRSPFGTAQSPLSAAATSSGRAAAGRPGGGLPAKCGLSWLHDAGKLHFLSLGGCGGLGFSMNPRNETFTALGFKLARALRISRENDSIIFWMFISSLIFCSVFVQEFLGCKIGTGLLFARLQPGLYRLG